MSKIRVAGAVHRATVEGFKKMLVEANRVAEDGYELVTIVPLEKGQLGCVFRRGARTEEPNAAHDSFFE